MTKATSISVVIWGLFISLVVFAAVTYASALIFDYAGLVFASMLFFGILLQIFKLGYFRYVKKCRYCSDSVHRITICWILYNSGCWISGLCLLFGMLLVCAKCEIYGLSTTIWFFIVLIVTLVITLLSRKALREEKKKIKPRLVEIMFFYFPRFFLMSSFIIYYCIIYLLNKKMSVDEIVPALFVIWLGVDRLVNLVSELKQTIQDTYDLCYEESDQLVRQRRKISIDNHPLPSNSSME